jgi:hypothetical protein
LYGTEIEIIPINVVTNMYHLKRESLGLKGFLKVRYKSMNSIEFSDKFILYSAKNVLFVKTLNDQTLKLFIQQNLEFKYG